MMKKYLTIVLMALCTVQVAKAQFFDDPMLFPGWNNRSMYRSGLKDLVSMRLGIGATHWNYREKPLKWSANLDLNLYQKFTIGMGVLGENDYYVSIGTDLFSSEGLEIEGGVQRFDFSSQKGFSNNVYVNGKITLKYPLYALVETSYTWNTNYKLMKSPFMVSGRMGLLINLTESGFGGLGGFGF
jgi:hypothetical protein